MSNVRGVLARVYVDDLDAALPLYQALAGVDEVRRFEFRGVQVAWVGSFLLFSGDTAPYRDRVATILVADMAPVVAAIEAAGGSLLEGPAPAPNGDRLIARHPDGSVFEYIEAKRPQANALAARPGRVRVSAAAASGRQADTTSTEVRPACALSRPNSGAATPPIDADRPRVTPPATPGRFGRYR